MLALIYDGRPRLVRNHPRPVRRRGEARLRLRVAGVCDTDLQLAKGYMSHRGVLGHEFVGQVVEADETRLVGRRVVADINAGCGDCDECRFGKGHHCARRTVLGIVGRDGAFAEELVLPERCLSVVPDSVSDERAVFAEPLAAASHVLDELDPAPRGPVLVLGDGKLGLLIALALAGAGVDVTLVGHHAEKLSLAAAAGVKTALEHELDACRSEPVVVEATGSAGGLARALGLVRPRGLLVLKTTLAEAPKIDLSPIVVNELRVVGSRCGDVERALRLLERGSVDPLPLVSERHPLERADEALARAGLPGMLKVLIEAG